MTTREPGDLTEEEEDLLGIQRPSIEDEEKAERERAERVELRRAFHESIHVPVLRFRLSLCHRS